MKKYLMGITAILLAIGFSAFSVESKAPKPFSGEKWFVFNGTDPTDLNDASMYSVDGDGSLPLVCPSDVTSSYRCEILAVPTGSPQRPDLATIISLRKKASQ